MTSLRFCIGLFICGCLPLIGQSDDISKGKKEKSSIPVEERVEKLLQSIKNERKDSDRAKAVEELASLASKDFPEIVSGIIDVLIRDDSSTVRKAAIHALADIKPATHEVKEAFEQASKHDKAWTVRQAARLAAWRYQPQDDPPTVPAPRMRNTSKPGSNGKTASEKGTPKMANPPVDPFKSMPIPTAPVPVVPAPGDPPAPPMAPAPARLTAPRSTVN